MTCTTPLYLERIDIERQMARFYAIRVERTLFGDWAVIYRWGRIGSRGRRQEDWMTTQGEVEIAVNRTLKKKMTRGYVVKADRYSREMEHAV